MGSSVESHGSEYGPMARVSCVLLFYTQPQTRVLFRLKKIS